MANKSMTTPFKRIASDRKEQALKQEITLLPTTATRSPFADHEARLPWLALLLKVQQLTDHAVSEVIQRETRRGKNLACATCVGKRLLHAWPRSIKRAEYW